jgi:hypothetical protein
MKTFTQEHARNIAAKLRMDVVSGRNHDQAIFKHGGKEIVRFGIRRGSGELGHQYIPKQLHMTNKECRELHDCTRTLEHFVESLRAKKLIPEEQKGAASTPSTSKP